VQAGKQDDLGVVRRKAWNRGGHRRKDEKMSEVGSRQ
jgi:hypothetical protein